MGIGAIIKAKINFNTWDLQEVSMSYDDDVYVRSIYDNDDIYTMEYVEYDGIKFYEIIGLDEYDMRLGTLFEEYQIIKEV